MVLLLIELTKHSNDVIPCNTRKEVLLLIELTKLSNANLSAYIINVFYYLLN